MKFTCDKTALLREISIAQDIISSKNALSILSNVNLEVDNSTLTIKATDLKVGFETRIPVNIEVPGSTTVYCDKFLGIIRSLPDGDIIIEEGNGRITIRPRARKIDFQLKSIASDKFPELQSVSDDLFFPISQQDLLDMIRQTIFAVSDDETRYFLNGVYLEKDDDTLVMVATDGRRLSFIRKNIKGLIPEFSPVIIPTKFLNIVRKLAYGEGQLYMAISDKNIFIKFDNQKIFSNLIEGQFPNYRRVIPEEQTSEVSVNKAEMMEALNRVSLLVEQKSRRLYMTLNDGIMTMNSEESEIGQAKEELDCEYDGSEVSIALNYVYMLDPLKVMEGEKVLIKFTEVNKALTLMSADTHDYFHIVMPMVVE